MGRSRREKWKRRAGMAWGVPYEHVAPPRLAPMWFGRLPAGLRTGLVGAMAGAAMASALVAIGLVRLLLAILVGGSVSTEGMGRGLLFYVGGFTVGGAVVGLLWPKRRWVGGTRGLGVIGMVLVMLAIVRSMVGPFATWDAGDWTGVAVLGGVFGLALGGGLRDGGAPG